jgi:hypothetical protein
MKEIYATESEADIIELQQACWDLGVAVYSAEPYNRTFIDGELVGQDSNGNDVLSAPRSNKWQEPRFDTGINKWYLISATEFNYSQPRQDALLAIVQGFPSVEIITDFVATVEEE